MKNLVHLVLPENAGSDASSTETTAVLKGDHYILNGGKIFITNAGKADIYIVFAVTTPDIGTHGISAFIVEKGWKGLPSVITMTSLVFVLHLLLNSYLMM